MFTTTVLIYKYYIPYLVFARIFREPSLKG